MREWANSACIPQGFSHLCRQLCGPRHQKLLRRDGHPACRWLRGANWQASRCELHSWLLCRLYLCYWSYFHDLWAAEPTLAAAPCQLCCLKDSVGGLLQHNLWNRRQALTCNSS